MGVHQLLMSPMFGLASMDSVVVEQARDTARKLQAKSTAKGKALTARERTQLQRSTEVLRAAPEWDAVPGYARQQAALLKELKATIAKQAARSAKPAAPAPAAKARPSTAKATKTAKASKAAAPASKPSTAAAKPASTPALSPGKLKAAVKRVERSK